MRNNRWNKMKESRVLKVLGFILLVVLSTAVILTLHISSKLSSFRKSDEVQAADSSSYYQSEACASIMEAEAAQIGQEVYEAYYDSSADEKQALWKHLDVSFAEDRSNSRYMVEKKNSTNDGYTKIHGNIQNEKSYGVVQSWIIYVDSVDDYVYIGDGIDDTSVPGFRVTIAVADPIVIEDRYFSSYTLFQRIGYTCTWVIPLALAIESILFILIVVYECLACGHVRNKEGIHETWIDEIPYELMSAVFLLFDFIWPQLTFESMDNAITFCAASVPCILLTIVWLLSTLTRIKSGHFARYTITSRLINSFHRMPAAWNICTIAITAVFVIVTICLAIMTESAAAVIVLICIDILMILLIINIIHSLWKIQNTSAQLAEGNLDYQISEGEMKYLYGPFYKVAENLNAIGKGMKTAVEEKIKSERLKTELITNVSHDLRTPLTSIISYADLLQKEHNQEQGKEYLEGISRQSKRLNRLCTDLIDASKASTGNMPVERGKVDIRELLNQSLAEYEERFEKKNLEINVNCSDLSAYADGRLLWRVLSNLFSNAAKYSMENTRVYIDVNKNDDQTITISIKNISKEKLNISAEELMERFIRGDSSRHTQGSGLGLDIARSLTELMDGRFQIVISGDLFTAEVRLPIWSESYSI